MRATSIYTAARNVTILKPIDFETQFAPTLLHINAAERNSYVFQGYSSIGFIVLTDWKESAKLVLMSVAFLSNQQRYSTSNYFSLGTGSCDAHRLGSSCAHRVRTRARCVSGGRGLWRTVNTIQEGRARARMAPCNSTSHWCSECSGARPQRNMPETDRTVVVQRGSPGGFLVAS